MSIIKTLKFVIIFLLLMEKKVVARTQNLVLYGKEINHTILHQLVAF